MHRSRCGHHPAEKAGALYRRRSTRRSGKSRRPTTRLYRDQTDLSREREGRPQSGRRCGQVVGGKILLSRRYAQQDREDHLRNRAGSKVSAAAPDSSSPAPHPYRGYFYIAGSAVFWGISATLGRAAFTGRLLPNSGIRSVNPLILSQARTTFSFVAVLLVLLSSRGWRRLQVPLPDLGRLLMLGLGGVAVSNYFYYVAIQRTDVATAIIVQYTAPVWVLVYMAARGF